MAGHLPQNPWRHVATGLETGATLEAAEKRRHGRGFGRALSNQNVGIQCDLGTVHNTVLETSPVSELRRPPAVASTRRGVKIGDPHTSRPRFSPADRGVGFERRGFRNQ